MLDLLDIEISSDELVMAELAGTIIKCDGYALGVNNVCLYAGGTRFNIHVYESSLRYKVAKSCVFYIQTNEHPGVILRLKGNRDSRKTQEWFNFLQDRIESINLQKYLANHIYRIPNWRLDDHIIMHGMPIKTEIRVIGNQIHFLKNQTILYISELQQCGFIDENSVLYIQNESTFYEILNIRPPILVALVNGVLT